MAPFSGQGFDRCLKYLHQKRLNPLWFIQGLFWGSDNFLLVPSLVVIGTEVRGSVTKEDSSHVVVFGAFSPSWLARLMPSGPWSSRLAFFDSSNCHRVLCFLYLIKKKVSFTLPRASSSAIVDLLISTFAVNLKQTPAFLTSYVAALVVLEFQEVMSFTFWSVKLLRQFTFEV